MKTLSTSLLFLLVFAHVAGGMSPSNQVASGISDSNPLPEGFPQSNRRKVCLNTNWRFHLGDPDQPYQRTELDDSGWEEVSIPHTLKLTSLNLDGCQDDKSQLTFHRTVGWYRKTIGIGEYARVLQPFTCQVRTSSIPKNDRCEGTRYRRTMEGQRCGQLRSSELPGFGTSFTLPI